MKYPIVQVKTSDDIWLFGLMLTDVGNKTVFLHTHGTASNFYEEYFIEVMAQKFLAHDVSMLCGNNRGSGVYDPYQKTGAAVELFEDCLLDLDAWIEFALKSGFEKIIISGHSLGTEKAVYYMNNGKYREKISGIVLLAPADSYGSHRLMDGRENTEIKDNIEKSLIQAEEMVKGGRGEDFLPRNTYGSRKGIMPKTANSLVNFLGVKSKLLEALPFATGNLTAFGNIKVPILVLIGDQEEYTAVDTLKALKMMKEYNPRTQTHQLKNCDHDFQGSEDVVADLVVHFLKEI